MHIGNKPVYSLCGLVCVRFAGADKPSGFGFELTFRLKREVGETAPPTWPAELMQGLARYVFQSGKSTTLYAHCTLWNNKNILVRLIFACSKLYTTNT